MAIPVDTSDDPLYRSYTKIIKNIIKYRHAHTHTVCVCVCVCVCNRGISSPFRPRLHGTSDQPWRAHLLEAGRRDRHAYVQTQAHAEHGKHLAETTASSDEYRSYPTAPAELLSGSLPRIRAGVFLRQRHRAAKAGKGHSGCGAGAVLCGRAQPLCFQRADIRRHAVCGGASPQWRQGKGTSGRCRAQCERARQKVDDARQAGARGHRQGGREARLGISAGTAPRRLRALDAHALGGTGRVSRRRRAGQAHGRRES